MIDEVERLKFTIKNLKNEMSYNDLEYKKEIIKLEGNYFCCILIC